MPVDSIIFIVIGAALGGLVNGLAGFGTGLFALVWWLQVLPPATAVALVVVSSFVGGLQGVFTLKQAPNWFRLGRFIIPAMIGLPFGYYLLDYINAVILKLLVGILLSLFGSFFILRPRFQLWRHDRKSFDMIIGFFGGLLGVIAGLSGALPTIWASLHNWGKNEQRAVIQSYNVFVLGIVMTLFALQGSLDQELWIAVGIAFPSTLVSARLGLYAFRRMSEAQYRQVLIWLMLGSGAILLVKELIIAQWLM